MNYRQAKKRAKNCFYIGLADAFLNKMQSVHEAMLKGEPIVWTLQPTPVGLGHNQHHFYEMVGFGKEIYKRYQVIR